MKKLFIVLTVIFITVGLSGCNLISQTQVDEISEEFCRENPTSEICQGDLVGELEDEIILNVFNTIIDEYNDETNETFCDDYFSVTNTELLDACRESRDSLVPSDYAGFTVVDVLRKTTLSTQDIYEITVMSEDMANEIVFTIGLVNVEGIMYINSWSYESTVVNPVDVEVTLEAATAYFEQFLEDYLDPTLQSIDVCTAYFGEDIDGCISERDESFDINFDVTFDVLVPTGVIGEFDVDINFNDDANGPSTDAETVSFTYDEDGSIIMKFIHEDEPYEENWLTAADAFEVIKMFLEDYSGYDVSHEDFNYMYFDNQMEWQFFQDRNIDRDEGAIMSVITVEDPTEEPFEYLVVTMQRTYEGENKTTVVKLRVNDLGEGRYVFDILFDEGDGRLDYNMLWEFLQDLIKDYQDPLLTDEEVCWMYFGPGDAEGCMEERQDELDGTATIALFGLYEIYDYYEIQFEHNDGNGPWYENVYANFYYDEFGELKIEFNDLGFDEINYNDALWFMENLVDQYSNFDLTSYDVCSQFFEGYSYDECVMRREQEMAEGIVLNGFELHHDGYGYKVEYFYSDSLSNTFAKSMNTYFYYNDFGELRLEFFEDFSLIPYNEVYPFIEQLVLDFNNWSMDTDYLCNYYFSPETAPGCIDKRNELIADNITISLFMLSEEYDHYRIEFEYTDQDYNNWFEVVNAYFWYDEFGKLKVDFHGEDHGQFPYEDAYNYLQSLIWDFNDPGFDDYSFCNMYFPGMSGDNCLWDRSILPLENMDVYMNWMDYHDNLFTAEISFYNNYNSEYWSRIVYLEFYYNEYGAIEIHMYDAPVKNYLNYNDSYNIIQQYIWDYVDPSIGFDQLNAWYFDYQMNWEFEEDRMMSFETGRTYVLYTITDPYMADGQDFLDVLIDVYENGIYIETMTVWMRVMPLGNGFHFIEFKDEGHQDYANISYDEAWNFLQMYTDDYNNFSINSYDVCVKYFGMDQYPMCMVRRDENMNDGIYAQLHGLDQDEWGFFYVDFGYYDSTDQFLWSEYSQVFFLYSDRGELNLSFQYNNYQNFFDYDEANNYIDQMFIDYYDSGMPSGVFCEYYGHIFPDCATLRDTVLDSGPGNMYLSAFWLNFDNVFYLEFAYHLDGQPANYIGLELAFFYDEFGTIIVDVWSSGPNFAYKTYAEAQVIYRDYIIDYLDPAIFTDYIVMTYFNGWIDQSFYDNRAQDLVNGTYVDVDALTFEDPYNGNGIDWITVTFNVLHGGETETVVENFRVIDYGGGMFELEMERHNPDIIDYPMAYDFFNQYIGELLLTQFSNEHFCAYYTDGFFYDECVTRRDEMMNKFGYIQIVDFYFDDFNYIYRATLDYYDAAGVWMETRNVDIWFYYNHDLFLKLEVYERYDNWDPLYDELWNMMMIFENEFMDPTIGSAEFCDEYYSGNQTCETFRNDVLARGLSHVMVEDFYWYPDCDSDGYCTGENMYEARLFFQFNDGSFIYQSVTVHPWWDTTTGYLRIELEITEEQMSIPANAVMADITVTEEVLIAFALDYANPDIDDETFCELYFGGATNCMEDRQEMIDAGGSALFITMEEMLDYAEIPFYLVDFELIMDGITESVQTPFRVWVLETGNYFIEFVEYYLLVNPLDAWVATIDQAETVYRNFLVEYVSIGNPDEYICEVYFQRYDPAFNCMEGRQQFIMAGGFTSFISIVEVPVSDGDNYFIVTLQQYNPYDSSFTTYDLAFHAYEDVYNNLFIVEIDHFSLPGGGEGMPLANLTEADAFIFVQQYYLDLVNTAITDAEFCAMYSHIIPSEQNIATDAQCIANRQLAQTYSTYSLITVSSEPGDSGSPDLFIATVSRDGVLVYSIFLFIDSDPIGVVASPEFTSLG